MKETKRLNEMKSMWFESCFKVLVLILYMLLQGMDGNIDESSAVCFDIPVSGKLDGKMYYYQP
ncbi:hypothetical protein EJ08DRAFT_647284 [Tothia fuscella]|uniref:Uncharacterized protein n=1 Tax=Tothia fuscella TaxID=1048955 RepID=A0A9P4NYH9_9PEZI|nr:hypothetical protein EJ08DRAFT_647284 [Tothia fuscella]